MVGTPGDLIAFPVVISTTVSNMVLEGDISKTPMKATLRGMCERDDANKDASGLPVAEHRRPRSSYTPAHNSGRFGFFFSTMFTMMSRRSISVW